MSVERDIRFELLARLCPNCTGQYYLKILPKNGYKCHLTNSLKRQVLSHSDAGATVSQTSLFSCAYVYIWSDILSSMSYLTPLYGRSSVKLNCTREMRSIMGRARAGYDGISSA